MPDVFTRKKRSEVMSLIRSRGNKETEITLMRLLRQHKISGWRRHALIRIPSPATRLPPFTVRPDQTWDQTQKQPRLLAKETQRQSKA
jgi:DNA mismatch endonuclease (patch repair protein)